MNKLPRRGFLKRATIAGAALATMPAALRGTQFGLAERAPEIATAVIPLARWSFALDPEDRGERQEWFDPMRAGPESKIAVVVPHTWQILPDTAQYQGVAWYWAGFDAPAEWAERTVRIEFEAVFHSAKVWLNGQLMGEHRTADIRRSPSTSLRRCVWTAPTNLLLGSIILSTPTCSREITPMIGPKTGHYSPRELVGFSPELY